MFRSTQTVKKCGYLGLTAKAWKNRGRFPNLDNFYQCIANVALMKKSIEKPERHMWLTNTKEVNTQFRDTRGHEIHDKMRDPFSDEEVREYATLAGPDLENALESVLSNPSQTSGNFWENSNAPLSVDEYFTAHDIDDPREWDKLLFAISASGTFGELMRTFQDMCERQLPRSARTYRAMVNAACGNKDPDMATHLIRHMGESGLNPNQLIYSELMKACVQAGDVRRAEQVLDIVEADGQTPGNDMFAVLLRSYITAGDADKAWKMFERLQLTDIKLNNRVYSLMMDTCALDSNAPRAVALLRQMKFEDLVPDTRTYNACIRACCCSDDLDGGYKEAFELFNQMKFEELQPNTMTFNSLLVGTSKQKELETAVDLIDLMETLDIEKDKHTYNLMLRNIANSQEVYHVGIHARKVSQNDRINMAHKLVEEMKGLDVPIDDDVVCSLLECYTRALRVNRAFRLHGRMEDKFGVSPSLRCFEALWTMCVKSKRIEELLKLKDEMIDLEFAVSDEMYRNILEISSKLGREDICDRTFREMEAAECDITMSDRLWVLRCSGTEGTQMRAIEMAKDQKSLQKLKERELLPKAHKKRKWLRKRAGKNLKGGERDDPSKPRGWHRMMDKNHRVQFDKQMKEHLEKYKTRRLQMEESGNLFTFLQN